MNICEGTKGCPHGGGDQCRRRPACQPGVVEAVAGCAGLVEADAARQAAPGGVGGAALARRRRAWCGRRGSGGERRTGRDEAAAGIAGLGEMRQWRAAPDWKRPRRAMVAGSASGQRWLLAMARRVGSVGERSRLTVDRTVFSPHIQTERMIVSTFAPTKYRCYYVKILYVFLRYIRAKLLSVVYREK